MSFSGGRLAERLQSPDDGSWEQFDARYRPMLHAFGRRLGLTIHDAEEATQRTILAFVRAIQTGRYDCRKGSIRQWLLGVARRQIADVLREQAKHKFAPYDRSRDSTALVSRDPKSVPSRSEAEQQTRILQQCLGQAMQHFSSRDTRVIEMLVLDGTSVNTVVARMHLSRNAVYLIKHRFVSYIRSIRDEIKVKDTV